MRGRARVGKVLLCLAVLVLAAMTFLSPAVAAPSAGCPSPIAITVAAGGSVQIDASSCDPFGTNPQDRVVQPAHGSVTIDNPSAGLLTYVHNGDSSTSDSFTFEDASAGLVTVNVTILPAASPLTIGPGTLTAPSVSAGYSQTLTTVGGVAPYSYSISGGSLPPGISLSAGGTISGVATGAGPYNFSVSVQDSTPGTALAGTKSYSFSVAAPALAVSPTSLANGARHVQYSQQFTTSGGTAPYSYSVVGGVLPPGLSLSQTGLLDGTPTASGSFSFTLRVIDKTTFSTGGEAFIDVPLTLTINVAPAITLSPATLPPAMVASGYGATVTASGGTGPYSFMVSAGSLPPGVSLSPSGAISGTPSGGGSYSFTVTATDSSAGHLTGSQAYTLTVAAPAPSISPASLPNGTVGLLYDQTLAASGGTPSFGFALVSGSLPAGLTLSGGGHLSGTPTAGGTFNFTVAATDSSTGTGPFTASRAYSLTIAAPTIAIAPSSLPGGTAGTAYSQSVTASGGTAPHSFAVTAGALPPGLSLASGGSSSAAVSGTPTTAGTFNFTVTATDSTGPGFSAGQAYSVTIAAPAIAIAPASLPDATAGTAYSASFTASGGTGPYHFQLASGSLPSGLSLSSAGVLSGTPAGSGSFSLAIEATDALGFTGTRSYDLAVTANPPTANPLTAETLDGQAVTVDVGGGSATSVAIATPPAHGTASVSGMAITYTPGATFTGTDTLAYTLTGAGGTSAPATLTITVRPRPVASGQQVSTPAATPVSVDLTENASGGPFTGATLVAVPPASAGAAALSGFTLTFTPAPGFAGTATVTFTLSNAFATSAVTAITITVAARADPTRDADVMGLLNAQTAATRRFASSQIGNFQQRLEALHDFAGDGAITNRVDFVQGVAIAVDSSCGAFDAVAQAAGACGSIQPAADPVWRDAGPQGRNGGSRVTVWTGGSINFGESGGSDGFDFRTTGLSAGIDYRLARDFVLGLGAGYGRDVSDVGDKGSRSTGSSYTAALYASYQPGRHFFLDGVTGYQWLSFDPERTVTAGGASADGQRDGSQWFASISAGGKFALDAWRITPYARLDLARASLEAYTEDGDPLTALHYGQQDVETTTGNLGLTLDYDYAAGFGTVSPQLRLQYQHDFQGDSDVTMSYADLLDGPFYSASVSGLGQDRLLLGAGLNIQTADDITLRLEYRGLLGSAGDTDNGILVNLGASF